MVGNDAVRDIVRDGCGLRTAYVGHARPKDAGLARPDGSPRARAARPYAACRAGTGRPTLPAPHPTPAVPRSSASVRVSRPFFSLV